MKPILRINFVGDICLHGITEKDEIKIDDNILKVLQNADYNCGNLESPITDTKIILPGQPIYLKALPIQNVFFDYFDIFSLANNHIMDYGPQGLEDTREFLTKNGKFFFGAGSSRAVAEKPLILDHCGYKIAFLGFTRYNEASSKKSGTAPYKLPKILETIRKLKKQNCFVIVLPHWNYQWVDYPSPYDWENGHRLVDAGADIIIGAHPHILQGYEEYKGKYIFHSLGNFVFNRTKYSKVSEKLGKTLILTLCLYEKSYEYKITWVHSDGLFLRELSGAEVIQIERYIKNISLPLFSKKDLAKRFYSSATNIDKNTNFVFKEMKKMHGVFSVIKDLLRANRQDIKKRLYSTYVNYIGKNK